MLLPEMELQVGQYFHSFEQLRSFVSTYEESNSCKLYLRDTKSLDSKNIALKGAKANKLLKYYSVLYVCQRGGKNFKSLSSGQRKTSTLQTGCEFKLRFTLSEDGQFLVLSDFNSTHNHPSEALGPTRRRRKVKIDNTNYVDEDLAIIRKANKNLTAPPDVSIQPEKITEHRPDHIESQKMLNTSAQEVTTKGLNRCRLCLNYFPKVIQIFKEDFPKMIEILTALKMDQSDARFPSVACLQCAKDVKNAIAVRKRIIHSQKTLIEEFKNQILQCVIETEQNEHPHDSYDSEEVIHIKEEDIDIPDLYPIQETLVEQSLVTDHTDILNDENVVYEVEVQAVCPNNTINESSIENEECFVLNDFDNDGCMEKFKPIIPNIGFRRNLQTTKFLEKSGLNKKRKPKSIALMQNDIPVLPLAKRKQILADYQKMKDKQKPEAGQIKTLGRRKPINALMNSKIRQRLTAIRQSTTEVFPKNEKIPCSVCQKIILGKNMIKHMDCHSNEPIKCTLCDAVCKNGNSLQSHIFYYHKCKADEFVCDECGRAFRFRYKFMLHKKVHHGGEKDYECQHCGKRFFTNVTLIRHIKAVHKKIKSHFCEYCGKGFQSKYGLRTHVRVHTLEAPYNCTFCDERFRQKVSLRNHLKSKHNIEENSTIFCETCGKGFSSDIALASHVRKLHEVQRCPQCSESFASAEFLNKHLRQVHGETADIEGYESRNDDQQCPLCSKIFANYDVLNNHMQNIHGVSNMTLNLNKSGERNAIGLSDFI